MYPRLDEWNLVIKVKYGDTLRRFGAHVYGNAIDHDMVKLKSKIINLFGFSPDAELTLTYIDEDGDTVTLDDDGELCDAAITQHLNPLRINVILKSTATDNSEEKVELTSSTSTRAPSPNIGLQPHQVTSVVNEAIKSIPEPLRSTLSKISNDYVSKALSSSSAFAEFLENFSKLGLSSQPPQGSSAATAASTQTIDLNVSEESKVLSDPIPLPAELPNRNSVILVPEGSNMMQGVGATIPSPVDHNLDNKHPSGHHHSVDVLLSSILKNNDVGLEKGLKTRQEEKSAIGDVPVAAQPTAHPYRRSHRYNDNMSRTFHRGVQCDGCGMHPIMGPRFKSNVKEDYDLCSFCFGEVGNEAEYTRIDRTPYRSPRYINESYNHHSRHRLASAHGFHGCGMRSSKMKLDSRFIQDVTVLDGTLLPPSTPFTKIWRMRNNGTIAWPYGTRLVWIGGDQLGNRGSIEIEIPANGCVVDQEIDIAVDFISPSRPGRYISYWRMSSPTGQKFGQRVWVLIQVDNSQPNSAAYINLNLPPESIGRSGHAVIDVNMEPVEGIYPVTTTAAELVKPFVNEVPAKTSEPASVDVLLGANDSVTQPTPGIVTPISYPIIDFPESSSNAPAVSVGSNIGTNIISDTNDDPMEHFLLKELEEMGFKQIDLNKEVLRQNEYNLEQSLDDLCGYAEWDPLLQELQEMGFKDEEMNRKLLMKNGGSIKHAVLDLVAGEKKD